MNVAGAARRGDIVTVEPTDDMIMKGRIKIDKALNQDKIYIPRDGKGVLMLYGGNQTQVKPKAIELSLN